MLSLLYAAFVILNEMKNLLVRDWEKQILHCVQNDKVEFGMINAALGITIYTIV